jgi:DNA repair protein RadD
MYFPLVEFEMIQLRDYQVDIIERTLESWEMPRADGESGFPNILATAATGAGKTAIIAGTIKTIDEPSVSVAHRQELVLQISEALAANDIYHNIVAPDNVIRMCTASHIDKFKRNFYHSKAPSIVASVQTLVNRRESLDRHLRQCKLWIGDEAHHFCRDNSWGRFENLVPNARGFGVTATPFRLDRKPLGRKYGGVFDHMVRGPQTRELIDRGYLCDYRLIVPVTSIDRAKIQISSTTNEFVESSLKEASENSTIVGDIVEQYMIHSMGKRAIAFVVSIETAKQVALKFIANGIPAIVLSSDTDGGIRRNAKKQMESGELLVIVNVALVGEGYDLPAVETVILGSPTQSLGWYLQMVGRALRLSQGKVKALIVDLVANYLVHNLPDITRHFSLDVDYKKSAKPKMQAEIPVRRCVSCYSAYEATTKTCPHCGHVHEPAGRRGPDQVDGDLTELSPEIMRKLRLGVEAVHNSGPAIPRGITDHAIIGHLHKRHRIRKETQLQLKDVINQWAGFELKNRTESEAYRAFYHKFGADVLTVQTLATPEMEGVKSKIEDEIALWSL